MKYKIEEIRNIRGYTQKDLAEKSGVSRATINGLESGRIVNTTTNILIKIAEALDVSVSEILDGGVIDE